MEEFNGIGGAQGDQAARWKTAPWTRTLRQGVVVLAARRWRQTAAAPSLTCRRFRAYRKGKGITVKTPSLTWTKCDRVHDQEVRKGRENGDDVTRFWVECIDATRVHRLKNKRLIHPRQQLRRRPRREPNPPACYPATERDLHLPGTPHISQLSCSHRRGSGTGFALAFFPSNPFPRSLPLAGVGFPILLVGVDFLLWAIPDSVSSSLQIMHLPRSLLCVLCGHFSMWCEPIAPQRAQKAPR